jgi:outer membrane protein assembly factor BamB
MGKRCRSAAWGATFALFVAACAASDEPSQSEAAAPSSSVSTPDRAPTQIVFPSSLADASFIQAEQPDGPCIAGDNSRVTLFDSSSGEETWSFPIPRPGGTSVLDGSTAYLSFQWDRDLRPGVGAIDIDGRVPLWQRFLDSEPEQIALSEDGLIVVTRQDVRALDPETGEDLWINDSEFDFSNVVLSSEFAYAIDSVGVHAIDFASGSVVWELPIERPDAVAANDETLAVASGPRVIAVDITNRTRLFDITADRLGAGQLWVTPTVVSVELSPNAAPGGGVVSFDRTTGYELWRATNIGEAFWIGDTQLVASTANDEPLPAQPFVLFGLNATTGEREWTVPATAQAFDSVVGTSDERIVTRDPHPAVSSLERIRLIETATGSVVWETVSDLHFDGATVAAGTFVSIYGSSDVIGADRGTVGMLLGSSRFWVGSPPDGISMAPQLTPYGLLVISGERSPVCLARSVGEPASQSAVLGASTQPS